MPFKTPILFLIAGSLLFSLPACASVHYLPSQSATYPPTTQVEVLLEKPTKLYTVLGLVVAETQPLISGISQFTTEEALLEEVKTKAKEIGANAIVITQVGRSQVLRSSPNFVTGGSSVSSRTMRRVEAVAIRFDVASDTATKWRGVGDGGVKKRCLEHVMGKGSGIFLVSVVG